MAPNGKGIQQLISKGSRKLGKEGARVSNRIISSYKPEEISGWKIFLGNLIKSPKAAAQANIERKT